MQRKKKQARWGEEFGVLLFVCFLHTSLRLTAFFLVNASFGWRNHEFDSSFGVYSQMGFPTELR